MDNSTSNYWHMLKTDFMDYIKSGRNHPREYKNFSRSIDLLVNYAIENDHAEYTPELGMDFYESEKERGYHGMTTLDRRRKTIRHLNEHLYGNNFWQRKPRDLRVYQKRGVKLQCPEQFCKVFDLFLDSIRKEGLKEVTVEQYRNACTKMILDFVEQGASEWNEIDAKMLINSYLRSTNKYHFVPYAKRLFRFLVSTDIITTDYSGILPAPSKRRPTPSVYTEAEIQQLLSSVETFTPQGKRDYAIILIAVRLGLRASDIRLLCFENIDFQNATVEFTQLKTSVDHKLSLPEEVSKALKNYISSGREESQEPYLFLDGYGHPLGRYTITNIVSRHFVKSGINFGDRHHGPHSLRMTFASQLISESVPYEVVRTLLGHVNPESTRHYVEYSIEGLRTCALEIPLPSGLLEKYLSGEEV